MGSMTRSYSRLRDYRYGYGGHEKMDEVSGSGNTVDMGDRWLDTRLGRTPKMDKRTIDYPDLSPYSYAGNNPILFTDPTGKIIVDPKTGKQVVRVGGEWKTIQKKNKDGSVVYGSVSEKFKTASQPVLDVLISTEVGTKIYNTLQDISTNVSIDTEDSYNKASLAESPANSTWSTKDGAFKTGKDELYKNVIITPDLERIRENAKADGVDFEERLIQTMSVEKDHISTKEQIIKEASYDYNFNTIEALEDVYSKPLNEAIRVGKEYRNEKKQTPDASSNAPVTNMNRNTGTNIKIEE